MKGAFPLLFLSGFRTLQYVFFPCTKWQQLVIFYVGLWVCLKGSTLIFLVTDFLCWFVCMLNHVLLWPFALAGRIIILLFLYGIGFHQMKHVVLPSWIFCSSTVVRLGWVHLCVSVFCDSNARGITTAFPVKCLFCKLHYHIYGSELKCFFRLKCGFELSFNICSLHYISKFSPRVMLHYEKRKMKTQQTPAIYPPMLASGLFKQGNPVEKVTLNLLQRQVSSRHCHERKEKGCF
ncbi:uncharacterized protein LOC130718897 isoform X2 [Lotus japonicus]|uniref:uncharacterized protein LOC130718897 isoform X2 n=1 Tax=Lotus japonicus TaxID=34305 RepID=UPI002583793C|nr:uncharacterized protein LOC130718897 isoform X2 [Lotus japonicus]